MGIFTGLQHEFFDSAEQLVLVDPNFDKGFGLARFIIQGLLQSDRRGVSGRRRNALREDYHNDEEAYRHWIQNSFHGHELPVVVPPAICKETERTIVPRAGLEPFQMHLFLEQAEGYVNALEKSTSLLTTMREIFEHCAQND